MNLLESISKDAFNKLIHIKFNNITSGFENYSNGILEPTDNSLELKESEELFHLFFKKALALNENYCYIDFYLKDLNENEIKSLYNCLEQKYKETFNKILDSSYDTIYFKLTTDIAIDFITNLNTKELFFCTIYFNVLPITIWGNYNLKFPVFFEDENILKAYENIASECNLKISSVKIKNS